LRKGGHHIPTKVITTSTATGYSGVEVGRPLFCYILYCTYVV